MSQESNPGQAANGAANDGDISDVDHSQMVPPSEPMLAAAALAKAKASAATLQATSSSSAAAAPTQIPNVPQPTGLTVQNQNAIVDSILQRLQEMGLAGQPSQPRPFTIPPSAIPEGEPEAETWNGQGWNDQGWDQGQTDAWFNQTTGQWNSGQTNGPRQRDPGLVSGSQSGDPWTTWRDREPTQWNQGRWDTNWKADNDRPFLSHLDFPSFNGNKDEFATYRYTVLNLKAQCGTQDYKYLAPRLISNFKGALKDDVLSM